MIRQDGKVNTEVPEQVYKKGQTDVELGVDEGTAPAQSQKSESWSPSKTAPPSIYARRVQTVREKSRANEAESARHGNSPSEDIPQVDRGEVDIETLRYIARRTLWCLVELNDLLVVCIMLDTVSGAWWKICKTRK